MKGGGVTKDVSSHAEWVICRIFSTNQGGSNGPI